MSASQPGSGAAGLFPQVYTEGVDPALQGRTGPRGSDPNSSANPVSGTTSSATSYPQVYAGSSSGQERSSLSASAGPRTPPTSGYASANSYVSAGTGAAPGSSWSAGSGPSALSRSSGLQAHPALASSATGASAYPDVSGNSSALPVQPLSGSSDGTQAWGYAADSHAHSNGLASPQQQFASYPASSQVSSSLLSGSQADPLAAPKASRMAAAALARVGGAAAPAGFAAAPAATRPQLGEDLRCTCPLVCIVRSAQRMAAAVPLPLMSLHYDVHCHIATAFVSLQLVCHYPMAWQEAPLLFCLPKAADTTISELCVENLARPNVFATAVVPLEDVGRLTAKGGGYAPGFNPEALDPSQSDPELFVLPLPPGLPGDQYRVKVAYFFPMAFDYEAGAYVLRLPTQLPQAALAQGSSPNSVLDVRVSMNTGLGEDVALEVGSHPVVISSSVPGSVAFEADAAQPWDNTDFAAGYRVWRDHVAASVHVEAPQPGLPDQRGTFALSVTPPGPERSVAFPRSIVFAFDRSGSMQGEPLRFAKAALLTGLNMLRPTDAFTVVAFDHEQLWWTDRLIAATKLNVVGCMQWVNDDLTARGTTDIKSPLQRALKLLQGAPGLPLVFLLTDGCVDDEREVVSMAEAALAAKGGGAALGDITVTAEGGLVSLVTEGAPGPVLGLTPRVHTFGIGPYCNHYFLKRLAASGRGLFDVAFRPHAIQATMERMLAASALPMLSDVQLSVQGLTDVELYPFPIPDVFVGAPLLVSGKFSGDWPEEVEVCGTLPDGSGWSQTVVTQPAGGIPLLKVFVKSQLDLMTANAWMQGNPAKLVHDIVELSVATGVASAHTAMVGFETTPERYKQMLAVPPAERRKRIAKWALGGAAGVAVVAGVAAALAFGDVAASAANAPVGDIAGFDITTLVADAGGCGDCGGCDCCGDCADACGGCLQC